MSSVREGMGQLLSQTGFAKDAGLTLSRGVVPCQASALTLSTFSPLQNNLCSTTSRRRFMRPTSWATPPPQFRGTSPRALGSRSTSATGSSTRRGHPPRLDCADVHIFCKIPTRAEYGYGQAWHAGAASCHSSFGAGLHVCSLKVTLSVKWRCSYVTGELG